MMPDGTWPAAPPITEVPEYVWLPRYGRTSWLPCRPAKRQEETGRQVPHPTVESALQAAKRACLSHPGRWLVRSSIGHEKTAFLVFEDGKVIERHLGP